MAGRYDYQDWLTSFAAEPTRGLELTVGLSWRVLDSFGDNLDGRLVERARNAGCSVWSEDRAGDRVYHLAGTAAQLSAPIKLLQADLNQVRERTFQVHGTNSWVASFHASMISACRDAGLESPHLTPYPGPRRSSLVVTLRGGTGNLTDLLDRISAALAEANGMTPSRAPRPSSPPIARPAPRPDLGLSA
jgi:hypothetical protein